MLVMVKVIAFSYCNFYSQTLFFRYANLDLYSVSLCFPSIFKVKLTVPKKSNKRLRDSYGFLQLGFFNSCQSRLDNRSQRTFALSESRLVIKYRLSVYRNGICLSQIAYLPKGGVSDEGCDCKILKRQNQTISL